MCSRIKSMLKKCAVNIYIYFFNYNYDADGWRTHHDHGSPSKKPEKISTGDSEAYEIICDLVHQKSYPFV